MVNLLETLKENFEGGRGDLQLSFHVGDVMVCEKMVCSAVLNAFFPFFFFFFIF